MLAVCNVQRETTTFQFRKNNVQMIFELLENNIKILDILLSEKLHKATLKTVCKVYAPEY